MENMYFSNSTNALRYLRRNGEQIFDGVYRMNDGRLIKRYSRQKSLDRDDEFCEEHLLDFKDLEIEGVAFTKALVYSTLTKIYATITKYADGEAINNKLLGTYNIDDLLLAIKKLETTVRSISDLGICAVDIYQGNIVYDGRNFTLIDTVEYKYGDGNISSIYEKNMLSIMNEVFASIFYDGGFGCVYRIHKFFSLCDSPYEALNCKEYLMNPYETLVNIRKLMEEEFGLNIKTFSQSYNLMDNVINRKTKIRHISSVRI